MDLPDHGPERILHDFLCILLASRDARGQAVRALTVRGDETLRRRRLVQSKRLQEVEIPVCTRPTSDRARFEFENRVKTHVLTPPSRESASISASPSLNLGVAPSST